MKIKPIVMECFSTIHTSFAVNFEFTNNVTILTGLSGSGKTAAFSFIRECMALNPNIICLNYLDYQKNIKEVLAQSKGKLIVIDNADTFINRTHSSEELRNCHNINSITKEQEVPISCLPTSIS